MADVHSLHIVLFCLFVTQRVEVQMEKMRPLSADLGLVSSNPSTHSFPFNICSARLENMNWRSAFIALECILVKVCVCATFSLHSNLKAPQFLFCLSQFFPLWFSQSS